MFADPQLIRIEAHTEIGLLIKRDASFVLERWAYRAVEEQPQAQRLHHEALLDHFRDLLEALSASLMETDTARTNGHRNSAFVHGQQRWEVGWALPEVIRDYQILRLVILDHLGEALERPLGYREVMAIGLVLDEAITESVLSYTTFRDEHARQLEGQRAELDRQIQEHLRQRAEALRDSDRRKNEFLATLAHELRNPLAPLQNGVGVLHLHPATDRTIVEIRDIFARQVRQLARLLDDLLDVSRIAQGKIALQKDTILLRTVVEQAVQMSMPLMQARRLQFAVELPPGSVWLEADPTRLAQVLVNLLNNAAKYTEHGGQVWLTAEQQGAMLDLRVRDTGAGIAPELLPHIFDLFTQAEWPAERSQGGLGIGLALVRRLVELHGGTITASSSGPGRGSEFVVRLPVLTVAPPRAAEQRHGPDPNAATSARRRILIVEDDTDGAATLAMILEIQGHEVQVANDGATALTLGEKFRPEVVLLDIGLPRMDGYQVAQQMRQQDWAKGALLFALTGYGQDEDRRRSAAVGFDAHLLKPVDLEALNRLLGAARDA